MYPISLQLSLSNGQVDPVHIMKAYKGSTATAPLTLNLRIILTVHFLFFPYHCVKGMSFLHYGKLPPLLTCVMIYSEMICCYEGVSSLSTIPIHSISQ